MKKQAALDVWIYCKQVESAKWYFDWQITIPANTNATLILPTGSARDVTENGIQLHKADGLSLLEQAPEKISLDASSGTYHFQIQHPEFASGPDKRKIPSYSR